MSEPLELRLPAPRGARPSAWPPVAVLVGLVLVVAPLAAIVTQEGRLWDRLDMMMLALAGLVMLIWGAVQLSGGRARLHHDTIVRLADEGAALHTGGPADGGWAHLRWPDLAVVEVTWWEIVPPFVEDPEHLPVVRFVSRDNLAIQAAARTELAADLAHAFGITPEAAALVAVVDPAAADALGRMQAWLAAHHPGVPMEIGSPPVL